jgi:K+-transporting ATPase ATPase C chain
MLARLFKELRIGIMLLLLLTLLTGVLYPAIITVTAQCLFPWRANGSLVMQNNKMIGSALIGQSFTDTKYFWGRPSATTPFPYNAENSMGSNLGPLNPDYFTLVKARKTLLETSDPLKNQGVPIDLLSASASGLDPEISPAAAFYQVHRIAKIRELTADQVENLIRKFIQTPDWKVLGETRVNVLLLNLALDALDQQNKLLKKDKPIVTEKPALGKVEEPGKVDKHKSKAKHKAL